MASSSSDRAPRDSNEYWQTRCRYYRGSAKIELKHLLHADIQTCTFSDKNVSRLLEIFRLEGARRVEPEHAVPALITEEVLQQSLQRSGLSRQSLFQHGELNSLNLAHGVTLNVLHGQHRLKAAAQFLAPTQGRWWRVELYDEGLPSDAVRHLSEEYANERAFCDGDIYRNLRHHERLGNVQQAAKWAARLTPAKLRDVKQLRDKEPGLCSAFDRLLPYIGLWSTVELGVLHRILPLHCPDLMINHLNRIENLWSFVLDESEDLKASVDAYTVRSLETLVPSLSIDDLARIREQMASGLLFPLITDSSIRARIQSKLEKVSEPIISLTTFFESIQLLELGMKPLRFLLPRARMSTKSLRSRLEQCLDPLTECSSVTVQVAEQTLEDRECQPTMFMTMALCQLFLYSVRHFAALNGVAPRKGRGAWRPLPIPSHEAAAWGLAELAYALGFRSEEIETIRRQQPELKLAQDFLISLRPDDEFDCAAHDRLELATTICRRVSEMARARTSVLEPVYTHDVCPLSKDHRLGRPHGDSHQADRKFLFLDHIYSTRAMNRRRFVTSLAMTRFTIIAFFGDMPLGRVVSPVSASNDPPQPPQDEKIPESTHSAGSEPDAALEVPTRTAQSGPQDAASAVVESLSSSTGVASEVFHHRGEDSGTDPISSLAQTRPDSFGSLLETDQTTDITIPLSQFVREHLQERSSASVKVCDPGERDYISFLLTDQAKFTSYAADFANKGFCFWVIEGESRVCTKCFDDVWEAAQENRIIIVLRKRNADTADKAIFNGQSLSELIDYLDSFQVA